MAAVELKRLTKRYGASAVVNDVSLTIPHGTLLCLLGPSGCGKTTTLRLIAGFIEPTEGEIFVGSRIVSSPRRTLPPEQRGMSMIFQSYALWPHMTVADNIAYGLKIRRVDSAVVAARLADILATTHLVPLAHRYPGELSGGQQQRVSLARALIVEPETLLLDEPLSNLDANLREEMRFEVRRLHDAFRYTTVYVTHDQAEAMTTADQIAVMNAGRIEQLGTPEEIYDRPRSEFVARFIGNSNILRGRALDSARIEVAGAPLATTGARLAAGDAVAISIRPHEIVLSPTAPQAANALAGRVARQIFLGTSRDYTVILSNGHEMRVTAPPAQVLAQGADVWLHLPPDRCRTLSG